MPDNPAFTDTDIFDYSAFRRRMLNNDAIIVKLIAGVVETIPRMLEDLNAFAEQGDVRLAGRQAHTIKGTAANLGCERFRRAALAIESASETGGPDAINSLLPAIETEWVRLEPALRKVIM